MSGKKYLFCKNHVENEVERLELVLIFKKALYEVTASRQHLILQ